MTVSEILLLKKSPCAFTLPDDANATKAIASNSLVMLLLLECEYIAYVSSYFVIRWNGCPLGEPVVDHVEIQRQRVLGMKAVAGVERRVDDQPAVIVDRVAHHVVAPVERELVLEERLGYVEVATREHVLEVLVGHHRVVQPRRHVHAQRRQAEVVHQHGHVGVGIGHVGGVLVLVVQRAHVEVEHDHVRQLLGGLHVPRRQANGAVYLEDAQRVGNRLPVSLLVGGEVAERAVDPPVLVDVVTTRQRADNTLGGVRLFTVEVIALYTKRAAQVELVLQ